MIREMTWPDVFGLDHPTWKYPACFFYSTAETAREAIERVYGSDSGHIVVRQSRVEQS